MTSISDSISSPAESSASSHAQSAASINLDTNSPVSGDRPNENGVSFLPRSGQGPNGSFSPLPIGDESSGLLAASSSHSIYRTFPSTSSKSAQPSPHGRHHRKNSDKSRRLVSSTRYDGRHALPDPLGERVWYNQFTSTDWMRDMIADSSRLKDLQRRKDLRGRLLARFDGAQGWMLSALVGFLTACTAYFVTVSDRLLFDLRNGYCVGHIFLPQGQCPQSNWYKWATLLEHVHAPRPVSEFAIYFMGMVLFAAIACMITLYSETTLPTAEAAPAIDEDLADRETTTQASFHEPRRKYYTAAGSGVAEVKVVLSGFVLHGYLGFKTLLLKTAGLIFSVSAGLCLGKEGPYVHIAACIGNISCRLFSKYNHNDAKRREVLSASAAGGVAVAFGAPISGVLFSLEEVSYYFPPKTLFRTFFCCVVAAISLKFLNPYGTGQIVLFEVRYLKDWELFEIGVFVLLGILGGTLGALFIKASRWWATSFRRLGPIRRSPPLEVLIVAAVTSLLSFGNRYTRLPVAELLLDLARPCTGSNFDLSARSTPTAPFLCPSSSNQIPGILASLAYAFLVKGALTVITFGIKVPAGIYVPSMVVGGLLGRTVGHFIQMMIMKHPSYGMFATCAAGGDPEGCVVPGVYALAAAGATMCGVTRLSVTLAIILFELTGSLNHVLPFSLTILVSKWTADALEPLSVYDLLTDMNSYPYLDNKRRPLFTADVNVLLSSTSLAPERIIDISASSFVRALELRNHLQYLHNRGELDGALPIVRDGILVGLIPAHDLEYALDEIENTAGSDQLMHALCALDVVPCQLPEIEEPLPFEASKASKYASWNSCLLAQSERASHYNNHNYEYHPTLPRLGRHCVFPPGSSQGLVYDFTPYINPAPVTLDIRAPMDQAYEHFVKLGLRHLCVLREGRFAGLIHKKAFVRYIKMHEKCPDGFDT